VAARRRGSRGVAVDPVIAGDPGLERLTRLVALLLVKGEPQAEQIRTLAAAGYGNSEIASLLGLTPNAVNIAMHRIRRKR
jgi:DNA-directed RNA polymerase specialized sigma24 family protein